MAFSGGLTGRITTLLAQAAELALLEGAAGAGIFTLPAEQEPDEADA